MGVLAKTGNVITGTLGSIVIPIGFAPKFFMMIGMGPLGAPSADLHIGFGMTDGTDKFLRLFYVRDITNSNFGGQESVQIYKAVIVGVVIIVEYAFVSFGATDVTISGIISPAGDRISWLALGGDVDADVHQLSTGVGLGALVKAGMAFQPNFLLSIFGSGSTGSGIGVVNATSRACLFSYMPGIGAPGTDSLLRTDQFISDSSFGAAQHQLTLTSFDVAGYTLNRILNLSDVPYGMAALKATGRVIGTANQPTANGTQVINVGIKPRLIILFTRSFIAVVPPHTSPGVTSCIGVASGVAEQQCTMYANFNDLPTTPRANKRFSDTTIINMVAIGIGITGNILATAELSAIGNLDFTLNWTLTDATAREFAYVVIGDAVAVTTDTVTAITATTATSGGTVTADPAITLTQRGVCWSTSPNPTIADSFTINGAGTGAFVSALTGLIPNTFYYVRAYALEGINEFYGDEETFMTLAFAASFKKLMMLGMGG